MKTKLVLLHLFTILIFFVGCASTHVALADMAPVAVVTVTANRTLPWLEKEEASNNGDAVDDADGLLSYAANKLLGKNNVEILTDQDRVDWAAESLNRLLEETGGLEVVSPEKVVSSKTYTESRENILNYMVALVSAGDYKNFMSIGAKKARLFMDDIGAKSLVMANFTFQKSCASGNKWTGEIAASVTMEIRLLDSRGKEVLNRTYRAISGETVPMRNRSYDKEALIELFPDTIDVAVNKFIMDCM